MSTGAHPSVNGNGSGSATVYCILPCDLAPKLHDLLRDHWRDDPLTKVVVERRGQTRRRQTEDRRSGDVARIPPGIERRGVRHAGGRRIADRRAATLPVPPRPLPRRAKSFSDRLAFVAVREPTEQHQLDIDTGRLVVRFQQGDRAAIQTLYLRYFDAVYGYARIALRNHHSAEDITQEVFARVLQALPSYDLRPDTPFRAWLFSITRNTVLTTLTQQRRLCLEDAHEVQRHRADIFSEELTSALTWLSDSEVAMFVERLTESQREVIVLRYMLDLSHREIAAVTDRSVKAVRMLHSRGLSLLRKRLVSIGYGPAHARRAPIRIRMRPLPALGARRFALAMPLRPQGALVRSTYRRAPIRF